MLSLLINQLKERIALYLEQLVDVGLKKGNFLRKCMLEECGEASRKTLFFVLLIF